MIPIVFIALNPSKRFQDAQNARRISDVNAILTAIHQYIVDNKGSFPAGLATSTAETQLGTAASGCAVATAGCSSVAAACVNLATPLNKYLKAMPIDPNGGTAATTNYTVTVDANNIVTVKACGAQGGTIISVSR
jgi:hypothetical protein